VIKKIANTIHFKFKAIIRNDKKEGTGALSKLKNKVVLITGASSGIGYALARELVHQGACTVLVARREERLVALKAEAGNLADNILVAKCDVTVKQDLERTVEEAHSAFGDIDIAVANAAVPMDGKFEKLSLADYRKVMETNVLGVLQTCYAILEDLKKTRGTLVIIGSISGYMASPDSSAYAMSKFAVRAFAEAIRDELAVHGIKVVLISPGFVRSEMRRLDRQGVYDPEKKDWVPSFLVMPAEKAARQIARAIVRGRREKFITWHGYIAYLIRQYTPWLYFAIVGSMNRIFRGR
jgi:short-subunit dehydrogenase